MRLDNMPASADVPESALRPDAITPNIYRVDLLDWLPYITFDAGPGQTMLKKKAFYEAADAGVVAAPCGLGNKVSKLIDLLEDGDRRLIANRAAKLSA